MLGLRGERGGEGEGGEGAEVATETCSCSVNCGPSTLAHPVLSGGGPRLPQSIYIFDIIVVEFSRMKPKITFSVKALKLKFYSRVPDSKVCHETGK